MKTSEILNIAADKIEQYGWNIQEGWFTDYPEGPLCLEGGIQAAMGFDVEWEVKEFASGGRPSQALTSCPAYIAVSSYLEEAGTIEPGARIYSFNDDEDRTKEEVIETLRAVAVIEAVREEALVTA